MSFVVLVGVAIVVVVKCWRVLEVGSDTQLSGALDEPWRFR